MSIGETIKKLRTAKKLTQEELASLLGITSKAVSQWECNRTSPDISQIPVLCNLFQISSDQLLNINLPKTEKEKQGILHRYYELSRKGYLKESWELLQESIADFPNDYSIMAHLSICGNRLCKFSEIDEREKDLIRNQCAEYCKRILDGCTDDFIRHSAVSNLCNYYAEKGDILKAEELAGKMPIIVMSQEFLFSNMYNGTKQKDAKQRLKQILLDLLLKRFESNCKLDSGENLYSSEEMAILREKKIAILELLFEDGDFGFYSAGLSDFHEATARHYASLGNVERALDHLEKAVKLAIDFITFMQNETFTHTSIFLKGMIEKSSNVSLSGTDNQAAQTLANMGRKEYDIVRETEKFNKFSAMLEPYINVKL
ncbi:MAG: helix-turn-helix transcriptional regulator [Clostridia bacterium]|nr:helix-turn-helix transcriptional regulator [Clostridia bacterium]